MKVIDETIVHLIGGQGRNARDGGKNRIVTCSVVSLQYLQSQVHVCAPPSSSVQIPEAE